MLGMFLVKLGFKVEDNSCLIEFLSNELIFSTHFDFTKDSNQMVSKIIS